MFDALLTLTTLIALCGVVKAAQGQSSLGWLIAGIGMGLGILSKGPVVFVHILPTALMGVWWARHIAGVKAPTACDAKEQDATNRPTQAGWYAGVFAAIVFAAAIGLGWAIPSAIAGGKAYAEELLLGQTAGRVVKSFSHRHHLLWYLPLLPLCTLPWLILGTVWRGMRELRLDGGVRFVTCWIVGSLVILSLISGKQVHYLMPVIPAIALLFGRLLSVAPGGVSAKDLRFLAVGTMAVACLPLLFNHMPVFQNLGLAGIVPDLFTPLMAGCGGLLFFVNRDRTEGSVLGISILTASNISLVMVAGSINFWQGFNVEGLSQYVASSRRPIAWYGEYHSQLNFAGRLEHLAVARSGDDLRAWMESNPQGLVIFRLASEGKTWSEFLMISAAEPTATERGQIPNSAQRALIDRILAEKAEFADLENKPQPEFIFWIRNGLKRKPFVILSQDRYQQPDEAKQLASEAQLDRLYN
jgi:4-amino-4-deoxy-L-arabinose transferase-like glycosyltransferase